MVLSQRTRAWTSLLVPPLAWYAFQQGLGHVVHVRCAAAGTVGLLAGLMALAICAACAALAWRLVRPDLNNAYPWMCRLAVLGAGVFALAIGFQTLAVLMVPPCAR